MQRRPHAHHTGERTNRLSGGIVGYVGKRPAQEPLASPHKAQAPRPQERRDLAGRRRARSRRSARSATWMRQRPSSARPRPRAGTSAAVPVAVAHPPATVGIASTAIAPPAGKKHEPRERRSRPRVSPRYASGLGCSPGHRRALTSALPPARNRAETASRPATGPRRRDPPPTHAPAPHRAVAVAQRGSVRRV